MEGDVNFLESNNDDCTVEINGENQRAKLVVPAISSETPVISESYELAVSKGKIPNHYTIDKYGENPEIDTGSTPEDIWEYGGEYTYDSYGTAPIVSLVSDNALDTQIISVEGLDIIGDFVSQDITLTGNIRKALDTPLWRVFRMGNEADDGNDINGVVYCYTGVGNVPLSTEIRAIIDNGNNQTLMALYTLRRGRVGFLYRGEIGASRGVAAAECRAAYYSRRLEKVFKVKKRVNVSNSGSSIYQDKRSFPDIIPALTDIKLRIEMVSSNDLGTFGTFDIMEVDESEFSTEYLQAIGQPGH